MECATPRSIPPMKLSRYVLRKGFLHSCIALAPLVVLLVLLAQHFADEASVYHFFHQFRHGHSFLTASVRLLTDWGNPFFYGVYGLLFWYGWKTNNTDLMRFVLAYVVVQILVSFGVVRILKITLGRPRPGEGELLHTFSFASRYNSLPSGHTCEIVGACLALVLYRQKLALSLVLGIVIALVAASRIYLGMHHPSDVAFGLLLGAFAGWVIYCFSETPDATHNPRQLPQSP